MASSWPRAPAPATASTSSLSHLPCIRAFHLSDTTCSTVLDVAQAVKHDREESGQHVLLAVRTLSEAKTWSLVLLSSSSWAKVSNLRTQLISESDSLISTVTEVNPAALYLYEKAMVVQLHNGAAALKNFLTTEEDCGLMVPLAISDDMLVTAWDESRGDDVYRLELSAGKAFVMSGSSQLRVQGEDMFVCVVFCLATGGRGET